MSRAWLAIVIALVACGKDEAEQVVPPDNSHPDMPYPPPPVPHPDQLPGPITDSCSAACARVEPVGDIAKLAAPIDAAAGLSAVGFGEDHWYVAWGGRPEIVTQLQRFTKDGKISGPTKKIDGTTPSRIAFHDGELHLWGWIPSASGAQGVQSSLHRFDASLTPIGDPLRFRATHRVFDETELADGKLTTTALAQRTVPLVREVTMNLSNLSESPILRDWHIPEAGGGDHSAYQRIGDKRFLVFYARRSIRVAELEPDGTVAAAAKVLTANFEDDNVVVLTRLVGNAWWIGGYTAGRSTTTFHGRKIDPTTLSGLGEPIAITFPLGNPDALVDANGTPMLTSLVYAGGMSRPAFLPIDENARAICRPSVVSIPKDGPNVSLRALHFVGETAGVVLETDTSQPNRSMYFARVACRSR